MEKLILSELTKIRDIDDTNAELLLTAGISLHALAESNPEKLAVLLAHLRDKHGLADVGPDKPELQSWIEQARDLDPITVAHEQLQARLANVGKVMTLQEWLGYLETQKHPSVKTMKFIVDQTMLVLEQLYVHMEMKRIRRAVDPIQSLRLLRQQLDDMQDDDHLHFHDQMLKILKSLGDIHTAYRLPPPYRHAVAFLPILLQTCYARHSEGETESYEPIYVVTHSLWQPSLDLPLKRGDEIISWNGVPMEEAVEEHARLVEGSNESAARAFGLQFMTMRWLGAAFQPKAPWADIGYRNEDGAEREIRLPWRIIDLNPDQDQGFMTRAQYLWFMFDPHGTSASDRGGFNPSLQIANATAMKIFACEKEVTDEMRQADDQRIQEVRQLVKKGGRKRQLRAAKMARPGAEDGETPGVEEPLKSNLKEYLEVDILTDKDGNRYGYIGIRAFPFPGKDETDRVSNFVLEFRRLLAHMPNNGLILDVRGNPGGFIPNAEMILQLLSPNSIEPLRFQFLASSLTRTITTDDASRPFLQQWGPSIDMAVRTGAPFSKGLPLTNPDDLNYWGQEYFGPVVLITSATSYSAADHFAASFDDNDVGTIIGVDETTGGGGANVWFYGKDLLRSLPKKTRDNLQKKWPDDINLQFAVRRVLRMKGNAGMPIEEIGVRTRRRRRYYMSKDDLLNGQQGLYEFAMNFLSGQRHYDLSVSRLNEGGRSGIEVKAYNMDWLDFHVDGRFDSTHDLNSGDEQWSEPVRLVFPKEPGAGLLVDIHGFKRTRRGIQMVAHYKHRLIDMDS